VRDRGAYVCVPGPAMVLDAQLSLRLELAQHRQQHLQHLQQGAGG
jgi:hypothetical protein